MANTFILEVNLEELHLLKNLLRIETIFQVKMHIDSSKLTSEERLTRICAFFDTFRIMDDQFIKMKRDIFSHGEIDKEEPFNIFVDEKTIEIYKLLTTETIKCRLPPSTRHLADKYLASLKEKIASCCKTDHFKDLDVNINILGITGIA